MFAYYNAWFKSEVQPAIERDRVMIAYPICVPRKVTSNGTYAPTTVYWALCRTPRILSLGGREIALPAGLSYGNAGDVGPGELPASLDGRPCPIPPVLGSDEEGRHVDGLLREWGLQFRYVELARNPG